jgi:TonB family protein
MKMEVIFPFRFFIAILTNVSLIASPVISQNITEPRCYGGSRLLKEFIKEELVYPEKSLAEKIAGTVVISFMVHKDGSTSDYKVKQLLSRETDEEALRISRLILWYPATDIGIPIDYQQTLEFRFDPKKYQSIVKSRGYDKIVYPYSPIDSSNIIIPMKEADLAPKPVYSSIDYNFSSFISNHLKYPEAAFKQNISGTVKLCFVVEPSGRISNILTEKFVGGGCTEEAIRVVKLMRWYPGILREKAVRTWMSLEITFDIAKKSVSGAIPAPGQVP